jgi:hypothetical protein
LVQIVAVDLRSADLMPDLLFYRRSVVHSSMYASSLIRSARCLVAGLVVTGHAYPVLIKYSPPGLQLIPLTIPL